MLTAPGIITAAALPSAYPLAAQSDIAARAQVGEAAPATRALIRLMALEEG